MYDDGLHKIGLSLAPTVRANQLKAELVWVIQTVNMRWLESYLHRAYSDCRVTGEWFKLSPDAVQLIKSFRTVRTMSDIPQPIRLLFEAQLTKAVKRDVVSVSLDPETSAALGRFIAAQPVPPKKAAVFMTALRELLIREGLL